MFLSIKASGGNEMFTGNCFFFISPSGLRRKSFLCNKLLQQQRSIQNHLLQDEPVSTDMFVFMQMFVKVVQLQAWPLI